MKDKSYVVTAELRTEKGSGSSRRMRRAGKVPAVLYGLPGGNKTLTLNQSEIVGLVGKPHILTLNLADGAQHPCLIQEAQWDHLTNTLLHIDLREINLDQVIRTTVPLVTKGNAAGESLGGIVEQILFEIEIECLPNRLPEKLEVDITALQVGEHISAGTLPTPEGIKVVAADPQALVLHVVLPKAVDKKPAEAEAGETAAAAAEPAKE